MQVLVFVLALLGAALGNAQAVERMQEIALTRGAHVPVLVRDQPGARATLLLLPGGNGETGAIVDGLPRSRNFLVRARAALAADDYNIVIAFRPDDLQTQDAAYRRTNRHVDEITAVVEWARREFGVPVWLVGTSLGTISATATAAALGERIAGVVLTSSIVSFPRGSVFNTSLGSIKVPTLVVHHAQDSCRACDPAIARRLTGSLSAAPIRKFVMIEGGANPHGDPCEAMHWHGFIGYEKETAALIADWIRTPRGD